MLSQNPATVSPSPQTDGGKSKLVPPEEPNIYNENETYTVDSSRYKELLKKNLGNLVFRRVHDVTHGEHLGSWYYTHQNRTPISNDEEFSSEEYDKNIVHEYKSFTFTTTRTALRPNDPLDGKWISGHSGSFVELDIYRWVLVRKRTTVPPRPKDLVCGILDKTKNKPTFYKWFICSEQFYRMWTIIMCGTVDFKVNDKEDLKRKLMTGNRLCGASYKKFLLRCKTSGITPTEEDLSKRFQVLRTERISIEWIHVYAAVVLMVYYQELPNVNNIPKNLDRYPPKNVESWDLPGNWLMSTFYFVRIGKKTTVTKLERKVYVRRERSLEVKNYNEEFPEL